MCQVLCARDFPGSWNDKESSCSEGDLGLIPGSERSPGGRMTTHSSILVWRIPWTEEPDWLQSMGSETSQTQLFTLPHVFILYKGLCSCVLYYTLRMEWGFLGWSVIKNLPASAGDTRDVGSIPGSGKSLGGGNGNPLWSSCPENFLDRES